jgi:hypothetical protein
MLSGVRPRLIRAGVLSTLLQCGHSLGARARTYHRSKSFSACQLGVSWEKNRSRNTKRRVVTPKEAVNVAADNTSTLSTSGPSLDCSCGHSTTMAPVTQSVATRGHPQALSERACGPQCQPFLTRPDFMSDTTVMLVKAAAPQYTGARRRGQRLHTRPARRGEVLILCLSALLWSVVTAAADTATEIRARGRA